MRVPKYRTDIGTIETLSSEERAALVEVSRRYPFRANDYYLSLINWRDPADPIRRIVLPDPNELAPWGRIDASNESDNYVVPGCQHKYRDTALLLINETCGAFCRFCFRKRLFLRHNDEVEIDPGPGLDYIRKTPVIRNVLLTGGDPLLLSNRRIERILAELSSIDHVGIIRIGSKMPAFNPFRISDDAELLKILARYSSPRRRIYLAAHFNHPRELTEQALEALDKLQRAGVILLNQTPILRGVNADSRVLTELMRRLSFAGVPPYYFFQCRPTEGNRHFALPIERSYKLLIQAARQVSGLARRARLVMSHDRGKIEVQGLTEQYIICRFHRARDPHDEGRIMLMRRDDRALWFDDLREFRKPGPAHHVQAGDRGKAARATRTDGGWPV